MFRFAGEEVVCDVLLENRTVRMPSLRFAALLADPLPRSLSSLEQSMIDLCSVDREAATKLLTELIDENILIPVCDKASSDQDAANREFSTWMDHGWLGALLFHLKIRNLQFSDAALNAGEQAITTGYEKLRASGDFPALYKSFADATYTALPRGSALGAESLEDVLFRRRSGGPWSSKAMKTDEVSTILQLSNLDASQVRLRAEQSIWRDARVLHDSRFIALETYVVALNIEGLCGGWYHYCMKTHALGALAKGDFTESMVRMISGQQRIASAKCVFIISIVWSRYLYRYRHSRAYATLMADVAELAHNYVLSATAFRRGTFITPAINGRVAQQFLGEPQLKESLFYVVGVG